MSLFSEHTYHKISILIKKAVTTEKILKKAADSINHQEFKKFYLSRAQQLHVFSHALLQELNKYRVNFYENSTLPKAASVEPWFDEQILHALEDKELLLEQVRNGEEEALQGYDQVLEAEELPESIINLLRKQRNAIDSSYRRAEYYALID